ncbi:hypothetical protein PACTADRAFT_16904 [Pachysolen tannophilus NRRL Y-2460]|uniref:Uncharacterized protein n=1 Tax=Pachysolen tannophilus NRRL Y-2460 TaxID=669874 RepID=A0A1E4TUD6_PACTA|nr:hypothetical protein PACTADRAFT_16904 [Pachysolen tannophilus NRRL Y-2460]
MQYESEFNQNPPAAEIGGTLKEYESESEISKSKNINQIFKKKQEDQQLYWTVKKIKGISSVQNTIYNLTYSYEENCNLRLISPYIYSTCLSANAILSMLKYPLKKISDYQTKAQYYRKSFSYISAGLNYFKEESDLADTLLNDFSNIKNSKNYSPVSEEKKLSFNDRQNAAEIDKNTQRLGTVYNCNNKDLMKVFIRFKNLLKAIGSKIVDYDIELDAIEEYIKDSTFQNYKEMNIILRRFILNLRTLNISSVLKAPEFGLYGDDNPFCIKYRAQLNDVVDELIYLLELEIFKNLVLMNDLSLNGIVILDDCVYNEFCNAMC